MAVNGIGGFAPFPLYIFDAQARARDQREQLAQEDAAVQETRAARRTDEDQRTRHEDLQRLDIVRLIEEQLVDLDDGRRAKRGSIIDILV